MTINGQQVKLADSLTGKITIGLMIAGLLGFFGWQATSLLALQADYGTHSAEGSIYRRNITILIDEVKQMRDVEARLETSLVQIKKSIDELSSFKNKGKRYTYDMGAIEKKERKANDAIEHAERIKQYEALESRVRALELRLARAQANQGTVIELLQKIDKKAP